MHLKKLAVGIIGFILIFATMARAEESYDFTKITYNQSFGYYGIISDPTGEILKMIGPGKKVIITKDDKQSHGLLTADPKTKEIILISDYLDLRKKVKEKFPFNISFLDGNKGIVINGIIQWNW